MKIAVAMSGGVDSLRAAMLLREQGHEVFAIHMRLLPPPAAGTRALGLLAEREGLLGELCSKCGIDLGFVDFHEEFESLVISPFIDSYRRGLTPNPCISCNPKIKFGFLLDHALKQGAERLATGHYARISPPGPAVLDAGCSTPDARSSIDAENRVLSTSLGRFRLYRAQDASRDQSYFLMGLGQEQLARAVFPLGTHTKRETVAWAKSLGLSTLTTEDSQEICFILSGKYADFVNDQTGTAQPREGPVLDLDGNLVGSHRGIHYYTVGQRRGLGIASTEPYYVIRLEPEINAVRVGRAKDLLCGSFTVRDVNWVSVPPPDGPIACRVRIRNQHRPAPAVATPINPDKGRGTFAALVTLLEPQRAITPGQAAVFYSGDLLLGGGIIERPPVQDL